jgi:hypothetical protein
MGDFMYFNITKKKIQPERRFLGGKNSPISRPPPLSAP